MADPLEVITFLVLIRIWMWIYSQFLAERYYVTLRSAYGMSCPSVGDVVAPYAEI